MGFRFRRNLTLGPNVRLNFSRSGVSETFGVPGAHVTEGTQPQINVGLPGSGVSYRASLSRAPRAAQAPGSNGCLPVLGFLTFLAVLSLGIALLLS